MNAVRQQLVVFERNGRILKWHDRMIPSGSEWKEHIDRRLERAKIILLFMSPDFIDSQYCYEVEGSLALHRHTTAQATVIPVILRPCAWQDTPFGALQALPKDATPISTWSNRDEGCLDVARGIMRVVDELTSRSPADTAARRLVYCSRCGQPAGIQSTCTGIHTHHEFRSGDRLDFCSRCGMQPGERTTCLGTYHGASFQASVTEYLLLEMWTDAGHRKRLLPGRTRITTLSLICRARPEVSTWLSCRGSGLTCTPTTRPRAVASGNCRATSPHSSNCLPASALRYFWIARKFSGAIAGAKLSIRESRHCSVLYRGPDPAVFYES